VRDVDTTEFVYVVYIATSPEELWRALLEPGMTSQYWQHENVSDWTPGSRWEHRRRDAARTLDLVGRAVESAPPGRLVLTWAFPGDETREEQHSRVTFEIEPFRNVTRLTVTHDRLEPGSDLLGGIMEGWPMVLSSLKLQFETGQPLPKLW
jgi:uncharacterized protein YndB with AHSA1/START domain